MALRFYTEDKLARHYAARLLTVVVVVVSLLLVSPLAVWGQASSDQSAPLRLSQLRRELRDVKNQIRSEQNRVSKLKREQEAIAKRLRELEVAQKSTVEQRDNLQESVIRLSTEGERLKLTLFGARQQMEHQRARMHRRLVALYKTKNRSPNADYLFRADSTTELLKRAKYLSRVTEHDQEYISQLSEVVRRGQGDRKRLEELLSERRSALARLTELSEQLSQQKFQTASLLREQEAKAQQRESSLVALKLSAKQLQSMLGEVMDSQQQSDDSSSSGVGLARVRGKLKFPVSGTLVQSFGKQRHNEFEDILFKKGLEVATTPGESVRVVAKGKVILCQELPGYGQVIIVDHGSRYYTLYGRVGKILVSVGDMLEAGSKIATTSELDPQGRNFYFELRYRGKAKNPKGYFIRFPKPA